MTGKVASRGFGPADCGTTPLGPLAIDRARGHQMMWSDPAHRCSFPGHLMSRSDNASGLHASPVVCSNNVVNCSSYYVVVARQVRALPCR